MKFKLVRPIGFYPPLLVSAGSLVTSTRFLALSNFFIRTFFYPFSFIASTFVTAGAIIAATFFNIVWCLGGFTNLSWSNKTQELNQIAISRSYWTLFDSLAFIRNQFTLLAGIFFPKFAAGTLKSLQTTMSATTNKWTDHIDWQVSHQTKMLGVTNYLFKKDYSRLAITAGTIIQEPAGTLVFARHYLSGYKKEPKKYRLNPDILTPEQLQHDPVIFLHGDCHNSSGAIPMARYFMQMKYPGALFTVNYQADENYVDNAEKRIWQIIHLFYQPGADCQRTIKVHLVGHSRGAEVAAHLKKKHGSIFDKVIFIGNDYIEQSQFEKNGEKPPIFITGSHDYIYDMAKPKSNPHRFFVNAGHLGSLSHPDTLEKCHQIIMDRGEAKENPSEEPDSSSSLLADNQPSRRRPHS